MPDAIVSISCFGRGPDDSKPLTEPVQVTIELDRYPVGGMISSGPRGCPYNTGGDGQRCKASHPDQDKVGEGVGCPYAFDYPYVLEFDRNWTPPADIKDAFERMKV